MVNIWLFLKYSRLLRFRMKATFSHSQMCTGGKIFGCENLDNKICVGEVEIRVSMSKIREL